MSAVTVNPNILGGRPCFAGTRVPVESLFDHLQRGYTVAQFLAQFPTVSAEQAREVLSMAQDQVQRQAIRAAG